MLTLKQIDLTCLYTQYCIPEDLLLRQKRNQASLIQTFMGFPRYVSREQFIATKVAKV